MLQHHLGSMVWYLKPLIVESCNRIYCMQEMYRIWGKSYAVKGIQRSKESAYRWLHFYGYSFVISFLFFYNYLYTNWISYLVALVDIVLLGN